MAGPWEKYERAPAEQPASEAGPWAKFKKTDAARDEVSTSEKVVQGLKDLAAGGFRGAGSIGATLVEGARKLGDASNAALPPELRPSITAGLAPSNDHLTLSNLITGEKPLSRDAETRAGMDAGLQSLGADPQALLYKGGKLSTEVAGTLGVGGALARAVGGTPWLNALSQSLSSGGMTTGMAPGVANVLTRVLGGAGTGAATAGLIDPQQAGAGAVIGGALPLVAQGAGAAGNFVSEKMQGGAKQLMQSSIKPTIAQLKSGDADTAVQVLLERGLSPNAKGVNKLRELIDGVDNQISAQIAGSNAQIAKQDVLNRLAGTRASFGNQVSPTGDLAAIQGVADDFLAHPNFPGAALPIQAAQDMKRGTYQVLAKKYGQMGGAETEAQKALARGLKEEIATAVPEVAKLNAEQAKLLTTLDVAERRALMEMNKNPMGLAALAQSPASWAMFMADKSAAFKSIAARMLNASSGGAGASVQLLGSPAANPVVRNALIRTLPPSTEASP